MRKKLTHKLNRMCTHTHPEDLLGGDELAWLGLQDTGPPCLALLCLLEGDVPRPF